MPRLRHRRPERTARFVRSIRPSRRPTFWMKHALLPHGPYLYLPSGARTRPSATDVVPEMNSELAFHDRFLTRHNEQRYCCSSASSIACSGDSLGASDSASTTTR